MDTKLDCGDNSCEFAETKTGMRTNGGCSCLKDLDFSRRMAVRGYIKALREENTRLRQIVKGVHGALTDSTTVVVPGSLDADLYAPVMQIVKERDEARAEVERLRSVLQDCLSIFRHPAFTDREGIGDRDLPSGVEDYA